ncbi:hypothetical protein L1785_18485 [Antribacter sp. KLBMP9083]|uniref:Uncharacterized protein n=1 Tax=Antribacter soli TaxID=2910976 RepID=A0AA41QIR9_9MICO|nr:hypothetical protein [Antribacter soli]MCF4122967.1 hypothetical protein [Antribacter soli]
MTDLHTRPAGQPQAPAPLPPVPGGLASATQVIAWVWVALAVCSFAASFGEARVVTEYAARGLTYLESPIVRTAG